MPSQNTSESRTSGPRPRRAPSRGEPRLPPKFKPMLAETATELPVGRQWIYEPKYDGFRCIVVASSGDIQLLSKTMKPLQRFFPELVAALSALPARGFILDAEIRSPVSFEELQSRLHPAASRIARLAIERPVYLTAFERILVAG